MTWNEISKGVFLFRDSCNVYAVEGTGGCVIINSGTGAWLKHIESLPREVAAVLCTHYFRDHSGGLPNVASKGIPIYVPEGERPLFEEPAEHFRRRNSHLIYDNHWMHFAPIEGIKPKGVLRDYDTVSIAGLDFDVIPLPGATMGQVGLALGCPTDGRRKLFCGETIHSPGKVPRVAPYQYNYTGLRGATNAYSSHSVIEHDRCDELFPSMGEPILENVPKAIRETKTNLSKLIKVHDFGPDLSPALLWRDSDERLKLIDNPKLRKISEHVWQSVEAEAVCTFIVSDSGKILALDYGYNCLAHERPNFSEPINRRAILHSLRALKQEFGTDQIDVVLVSHFHDDHVAGIPILQRLQGTQCWAPESFAHLLEYPDAHCFPCNWPEPCRIDRKIGIDETVTWEGFEFHFGAMSGHTRYSALIGFEADGLKFAHTGDQYFFISNGGHHGEKGIENFDQMQRQQNHVYRNGALLDGYDLSGAWLQNFRPDVVLSGHAWPMFTNQSFFDQIAQWPKDYSELHRIIMPLDDEEEHLNLDSCGGWIWPYRNKMLAPGTLTVEVTLRNPHNKNAQMEARLVGQGGHIGRSKCVSARPREEIKLHLSLEMLETCDHVPIAVDLTIDGNAKGHVAEAHVSVGGN